MPKIKYTKIKLLVHPLYDPILKYIGGAITKEQFFRIIKINMAEYGKAVLDCKKEPNTLFVLVNIGYVDKHFKSIYDLFMIKFKEFAIQRLGISFYSTDYYDDKDVYLSDEIKQQLSKEIKIESFGEYGDGCVSVWPNS